MVINLIIDHDKVHPQIFINNKGKCVRIQIQKLKCVKIVKHLLFYFFFSFRSSFTFFFLLSRLYSSKQCYISRLFFATILSAFTFPSYDSLLIFFVFRSSFRFCNGDMRLFFTTYIQLFPTSLIYIYICN
jgi:hypothetical protein